MRQAVDALNPAMQVGERHGLGDEGYSGIPVVPVDSCAGNAGVWSAAAKTITHASAPLLTLLNHTLQYSDNLYAEAILRALGNGSAAAGLATNAAVLGNLGVSFEGMIHDDGCGLSRHNLFSPLFFTTLLAAMVPSALARLLPVAGRSGTLADRFVGTAAEGIVQAKTGTMSGVSALSGHVFVFILLLLFFLLASSFSDYQDVNIFRVVKISLNPLPSTT